MKHDYAKYKKYILKWPINVSKMDEEAFHMVIDRIIEQLEYVESKKLFDDEYYVNTYPEVLETDLTPIEHYFFVGFICSNGNGKNPNKDFDTFAYQEKIKNVVRILVNPLYHFAIYKDLVKSVDEINGDFDRYESFVFSDDLKVVKLDTENHKKNDVDFKILVHVHCFYLDILEEILDRFISFKNVFDFVITTDTAEKSNEIEALLNSKEIKGEIFVVDNRGRDVGPFYVGLKSIYKNYDILLHMHTKKSPKNNAQIRWFEDILDKLAYNESYILNILELFKNYNNLGVVIPSILEKLRKDTMWLENNYTKAEVLVQEMGYNTEDLKSFMLKFAVGNMFWARTDAIEPIFSLDLDYGDFPEEPLDDDGTIAHALERLQCFVAEREGYFSCAVEPKN